MSTPITLSAQAVPGFLASATYAGLRKTRTDDLALIYAPKGAHVAAVYTQSNVAAAPVIISRRHTQDGEATAAVINSANANACTGEKGLGAAVTTCQAVASVLGIEPREVIVSSTGVIGVELPTEKITARIDALVSGLAPTSGALEVVAQAIMTTDLAAKIASTIVNVEDATYTICGIAKGSGMIAPNMATIISYVLTDAPLSKEACQQVWSEAMSKSLNCVTVDGDTSTNDTAVLMSSGAQLYGEEIAVGDSGYEEIKDAIIAVCIELAKAIARDGEGATKLITVNVTGAADADDAKAVALSIGNSPLVKTALFGCDANWGRVAMAAGKAGASFDQAKMAITLGGIEVCKEGTALPFDEDSALSALDQSEVEVRVDLGAGSAAATVWTCDFSYEYVRINGEYRS